ncbi:hypothetical protein M1525_01080 [Patescibacteria group bacterium]|nr:hypothetical protein [Patescibacteria group bacterium]
MVIKSEEVAKIERVGLKTILIFLATIIFGSSTAYLGLIVFLQLNFNLFNVFILSALIWLLFDILLELGGDFIISFLAQVIVAVFLSVWFYRLTGNVNLASWSFLIFIIVSLNAFWRMMSVEQAKLKINWLGLTRAKWTVVNWFLILILIIVVFTSSGQDFISAQNFNRLANLTTPIFSQVSQSLKVQITPETKVSEIISSNIMSESSVVNLSNLGLPVGSTSQPIQVSTGTIEAAAVSPTLSNLNNKLKTNINPNDTLSQAVYKYLSSFWLNSSRDQLKFYAVKIILALLIVVIVQSILWFYGWVLSFIAWFCFYILGKLGLYRIEKEMVEREKISLGF